MAFTEHLPAYFVDFGTTATYLAASVKGILDTPMADQFGILGTAPRFICAAADVSGIAAGATLTIGGIGYTVSEVRPDGTGMMELVLDKSS